MSVERITMPWGYVEFGNNEVSVISTVTDPPKVRMATLMGVGLGAVSWGRLRSDGRQEEMVLLQGKQDERRRNNPLDYSGELTIHLRNGALQGDAAMVKIVELRHDTVWIKGLTP